MAQLNVRLDGFLVRRFETTAAALGRSYRDAVAEALSIWTDANASAVRAVIEGETPGALGTKLSAPDLPPAPLAASVGTNSTAKRTE